MAVSLPALLHVIKREERKVDNLILLLEDPRARLLAMRLQKFKRQIQVINSIIDPAVEVASHPLSEREVATLNKFYFAKIRGGLASATSGLTVALTSIMDVLFDVDPAVEAETDLTSNLGKVYRATITQLEKMFSALQAVESTVFPDEILRNTANLRKAWNDLQLLLTNQIVEPLQSSLAELARENALKQLSQKIYGSTQVG